MSNVILTMSSLSGRGELAHTFSACKWDSTAHLTEVSLRRRQQGVLRLCLLKGHLCTPTFTLAVPPMSQHSVSLCTLLLSRPFPTASPEGPSPVL